MYKPTSRNTAIVMGTAIAILLISAVLKWIFQAPNAVLVPMYLSALVLVIGSGAWFMVDGRRELLEDADRRNAGAGR
ncbi:hypothetical protein [Streptomyces beijiangensis]|uniref:hypothetical protein n=1 Tax=Streptomyces beijiangensis TaxID=163361 RepID=UPI0031D92DE5